MSLLVLASRSPARRTLLEAAGVSFETEAAQVDEDELKAEAVRGGSTPYDVAERLAAAKALEVSRRREGWVIGADQTLDLDGRLYDKPRSREAARTQLLSLRGRTHRLHSALALAKAGQVVWLGVESAALTMLSFSDGFLDAYLDQEGDHLLGCVGAYRLEALGARLFERIDGDYFTVLGLPLLTLLGVLREQGVIPA